MNPNLLYKLLFARLGCGHPVEITVEGVSMNPTLYESDIVTVKQESSYEIGDLLVFLYKGKLLVHRLLKTDGNTYYCKGDNAFRLEDVPLTDIAGKVILHNGAALAPVPSWLPALSYRVNRVFREKRYNVEQTKKSGTYRFYKKILFKSEDNPMIYKKNDAMDYILSDETSLAVFDPESGDTHFFDETGIDILNCLADPCDLSTLLARLCEIYEASSEDIREDVEEFLAEVIAKKVVLAE